MLKLFRVQVLVFVGLTTLALIGCAEKETDLTEHPGLQTYTKYCASCHNAGIADAPKLGDRDKWQWRVSKGPDALLQTTIDGIPPGMPKKGMCMSCSDEQLVDAIDYMLAAVGAGAS